jgi:hypothetical protein
MSEASSLKLGSWFGRSVGEESSVAGTLETEAFLRPSVIVSGLGAVVKPSVL